MKRPLPWPTRRVTVVAAQANSAALGQPPAGQDCAAGSGPPTTSAVVEVRPWRSSTAGDDRGRPGAGRAPTPFGLHVGDLGGTEGRPRHPRAHGIGTMVKDMFALPARRRLLSRHAVVPRNLGPAGPGRCSATGFPPDVRRFGVTSFNDVGTPPCPSRPRRSSPTTPTPPGAGFGNERAGANVEHFAEGFGGRVSEPTGRPRAGRRSPVRPTPGGPRWAGPRGHRRARPGHRRGGRRGALRRPGRLVNPAGAMGELVSRNAAAGFKGYGRNDEAGRARRRHGRCWNDDLASGDEPGFSPSRAGTTTGGGSTARRSPRTRPIPSRGPTRPGRTAGR